MKKNNSVFKNIYCPENLGPSARGGLIFLSVFLSLYLAVPEALYLTASVSVKSICLSLAAAAAVFVLLTVLLKYSDKIYIKRGAESRFPCKAMVIFSAAALLLLFIWWYAYYPGGYEMDAEKHWYQMSSGDFSDWHPAIYSILLWVCGLVIKSYPAMLLVQQFFIALALGYMGANMIRRGFNKYLAAVCVLFAAASPVGGTVSNYLGKDNAFAFFMILYVTQLTDIFLSEGAWLDDKKHTVAFGVVLCLVTLLRHNGIFATLALAITVFFAYKKYRRRFLAAAATALLLIAGIRGPLYKLCNVSYSDTQVYEETVGLPLTMMGWVMRADGDKLPPTAYSYMCSILTEEGWQNKFFYCWNDVKWADERLATVYNMGAPVFAEAFAECVRTDPDLAVYGGLNLTRVVWQTAGTLSWDYTPGIAYWTPISWGEDAPLPLQNVFSAVCAWFYGFTALPGINCLFWFCGFQLALLLLCSLIAYRRHGARALIFAMSIFAYDMGTSLLLCGYDLRFFYFNFLVNLPACLCLLSVKSEEKDPLNNNN